MGFTMASKKNVFTQLVAAGKSDNVWAMCMTQVRRNANLLHVGLHLTPLAFLRAPNPTALSPSEALTLVCLLMAK
jgi:hypothetical protein